MTRILFSGGRVVDGTGADPADADVVVEDGRIVEVGPGLDGDERVDVTGKALLPGLFDCHTHVVFSTIDTMRRIQTPFSYRFYQAMHNLEATLRIGITTVRDAGGADLGVKQAVEDGLIRGPRMQISLGMISQTGGHGDGWLPSGANLRLDSHPGVPNTIVDGPDEMRAKVRELVRMGADVIKVAVSGGVLSPRDKPTHAHFRLEELKVLVEEATAAGIWVMAHAQATPGIKNAIRAGIRSIDHGIYLDDEAIEMMLARGTWLVPTLVAPRGVIDAAAAGAAIPEASVAKAHEVAEIHRASFAKAVEAGVKVAMGTDSGVTPHGNNLRELQLMVEGGMTPMQAIVATTQSAAQLMGLEDELGTLEPGKRADLVVVDGDPLDVATLTDRIEAVYQDGARVV
ncbi:MAG TPA: amidohydrolase family protein [Candidatus Limnocylindria bacterium]|jgi:imidazolonepropionase-like amidohydrolase|nr:amidohydrolase family protein [Candidatus Limnocylindria bacterium]